jgi:hypothetical protein
LEKVDTASSAELMHIMQGFRNKENKGMYQTIRKTLVERKKSLSLEGNDLINMFFQFASGRPRTFGVYRFYANEELDELLAHYEHELVEAAEKADPEHVTRLAQALYILKSDRYENIWWRIENRVNELALEGKLDEYHLVNILRAFSRAQNNHMVAQEKTFVHLESFVL